MASNNLMQYLQFSNGEKMPLVGLGLWKGGDESDIEVAVEKALEIGYRHFDTAYFYETEEALGRALKKWMDSGKGKREDLYIVTKLPWNGNDPAKVEHFIKLSLKDLQLDYVDLYLIHWPCSVQYVSDKEMEPKTSTGELWADHSTDLEGIWKEMEKQVDAKRTKSIGISNFNEKQIERIVRISRIQPAHHQVEMHVYFQQKALREACKKYNITLCAYSPLGSPWRKTFPGLGDNLPDAVDILDNTVVKEIAKKHSKSPGQILLRYLIELNVAVIPKSSNPERLAQNFQLFDFSLDVTDKKRLEELDRGDDGRTNYPWAGLKGHPEIPF